MIFLYFSAPIDPIWDIVMKLYLQLEGTYNFFL